MESVLPGLLLILLLLLAFYIIREAQKPGNYWSDVFSDDGGKRSALRVATLVALAVSSAALLFLVTRDTADLGKVYDFFVLYLAAWSGAPVISKFLDMLAIRVGTRPAAPERPQGG